ncbi:MAG: AmmeMemoRadiSam system protein B [Rhodospirillales bacterium]|nr:AmmeMemoRadiSam system protein B [Acetobacter sp.]
MSVALPRLRLNLDFFPSPDRAKPGLYIRDPYGYSDSTLLIPPQLVPALECFDGVQTQLELRAELVRITGQIQVSDIERNIFDSLNEAGFLDNDRYRSLKIEREKAFAEEKVRPAIFAGAAYPESEEGLSDLLSNKIGKPGGKVGTIAIAAPHASPDGGWNTYRAAYEALPAKEAARDKTFVILGTSHYGAPERFGLTRKPYLTPFGSAHTDQRLVDELATKAPGAIRMEDYCHAVEHSIEFQVVFLQYLYGPDINVVPILCGPFVKSLYEGGLPEDSEDVRSFFDALSEMNAREGQKLFWILGIDLAHIGRRYGDPVTASANTGDMLNVAERDRKRIERITSGDRHGYWSQVQEGHDDLKWCGAAPLYTFMKTQDRLQGELLDYHQWQIDPHSVVSFGALSFERPA